MNQVQPSTSKRASRTTIALPLKKAPVPMRLGMEPKSGLERSHW